MVVLSSFFIHIIIDGITYSFGIIFIRLLEDFQARTGDTALVLSTFVGMTLGSGETEFSLWVLLCNRNT